MTYRCGDSSPPPPPPKPQNSAGDNGSVTHGDAMAARTPEYEATLDALEAMVRQHCSGSGYVIRPEPMSAHEAAIEVLLDHDRIIPYHDRIIPFGDEFEEYIPTDASWPAYRVRDANEKPSRLDETVDDDAPILVEHLSREILSTREVCEAIASLFGAVRLSDTKVPEGELQMVLVHGWMQTVLGYRHPSGVDMSGWREEAKAAGVELSEWPSVERGDDDHEANVDEDEADEEFDVLTWDEIEARLAAEELEGDEDKTEGSDDDDAPGESPGTAEEAKAAGVELSEWPSVTPCEECGVDGMEASLRELMAARDRWFVHEDRDALIWPIVSVLIGAARMSTLDDGEGRTQAFFDTPRRILLRRTKCRWNGGGSAPVDFDGYLYQCEAGIEHRAGYGLEWMKQAARSLSPGGEVVLDWEAP